MPIIIIIPLHFQLTKLSSLQLLFKVTLRWHRLRSLSSIFSIRTCLARFQSSIINVTSPLRQRYSPESGMLQLCSLTFSLFRIQLSLPIPRYRRSRITLKNPIWGLKWAAVLGGRRYWEGRLYFIKQASASSTADFVVCILT